MMPRDQAWTPTAGEDVVILWNGTRQTRVTRSKVVKVGKRDVVLENGRRFNIATKTPIGEGRYAREELAPANDLRVAEAAKEAAKSQARNDVLTAAEHFRSNAHPGTASKLAEAATKYIAMHEGDDA